MELMRHDRPGITLVQVSGKLTATRISESLRGLVKEVLSTGVHQIIIDMAKVDHIDSTGVGELVSAYTAVSKEKGSLYLWHVSDSVRELLQTTNLLEVFTVLADNAPEAKVFSGL